MNLHPYHNYAVLLNKDFHKMIEEELRSNLATNANAYNQIKEKIKILEKKNKVTEHNLLELKVSEDMFSQSQTTLNLWNSKKITRITENQIETLFGNPTTI